MRPIVLTREEAQHRPALPGHVVTDGPAQHRIAGLEGVEDRALGDGTGDLQLHLAAHVRQRPQMIGKNHANHGRVWTSTENTGGRSRTIGDQLSPELADTYTCPPVVPK